MIAEPSRPEGPLLISDVEFDSVHLSWKPPSEDNGGRIQGYIVEAKDVMHVDVRKMEIWSEGEGTELTVRHLETSHIYQFRVYAQNEAGRGEGLLNKTLVRIKAKTKKPPRPSKLTAEPRGADSVLLKWTLPEEMGELNFLIERFEPRSDLWLQCNRETISTTAFLITGLSSEREYRFRVSSENQHGVSKPSEESDVVQLRQLQGEAPYVLVPLQDCCVKSNDCAVFRCEYAGTRPIQVQWTKDGLRVSENFGAVVKTENEKSSELQLTEVDSDDDECFVQCSLKNSFGKASSEAKIRTLNSPQLRYPSSYKEGLTFDSGDTLRLRVTASGTPAPDLQWWFDGSRPSADTRIKTDHQRDSMEIRIEDLRNEHSGNYKIVARNELGEDSVTVKVTISGPPDPPEGHLWFDLIDNDEISLNWCPPPHDGGSEVFSYQVEKKPPESSEWLKFSSTHKMSLNLESPHLFEGCYFRVRAVNIYGTSVPSREEKYEKEQFRKCKNAPSIQISTNQNSTHNSQEHSNVASTEEYESREPSQTQPCIVDDALLQCPPFENKEKEENINRNVESYELIGNTFTSEEPISYPSFIQETSFPLIHYANRETETFNETICIDTEMLPEVQYPVHIFEELQCYIVFSVNMVFEFCVSLLDFVHPPEDFCSISFISEINYLEVFSLVNFVQITQFEPKIQRHNEICDEIIVGNQIRHDFITPNSKNIEHREQLNINESLIVTLHPFILEDSAISSIFIEQSENCRIIINYYKAVTVFINQLFETVVDYVHRNPYYENSVSITHNTDFETLVDILPLPVTTFKPAMSVLPVRRKVEPLADSQRSESTASSLSRKYKEITRFKEYFNDPYCMAKISRVHDKKRLTGCDNYNVHDQVLNKFTYPQETSSLKETASLCSWMRPNWLPNVSPCKIESQIGKLIDVDTNNRKENNVRELLKLMEGTSELSDTDADDLKKNLKETNIKDLFQSAENDLEFSDFDVDDYKYNLKESTVVELLPLLEETSELANIDEDIFEYFPKEDRNAQELMQQLTVNVDLCKYNQKENAFQDVLEITEEASELVDVDVCKYNLKEKSVQELLQLAEEVERSFGQKAEQIESLECVLQEELTSLEKDLKTVNEIHRSLRDSFDTIESNIIDHLTDESNNFETELSKDLIELNDDIPLMDQQKMEPAKYAPEVIVHLQNRIVQCGNRTRLYCSIIGNPIPDIFWIKNGKPLSRSSRYICTNLEEYGFFIDIYNAKSTDSGVYACIATNQHGSVQSQAYLRVVGKRENSPEEPKFLKSPDDLCVIAGETVVLEWNISGMPFPSVIWFKNAEKIDSSLRIDTFSNHRGLCRLVLRDADADDSAIFSCYLENECGSAISTMLLSVTDGTVPPNDISRKESDPFEAQPKLGLVRLETQSLTRRSPSCSLESSKLHHRKILQTKKRTEALPCPPFDFRVVQVGQAWVLLSWTPPLDPCERRSRLEYRVERRLLNGHSWKEVGRTHGTLYTAHGFKRGRSYVLRVSSGFSCGVWGFPSTLPQPIHFPPK